VCLLQFWGRVLDDDVGKKWTVFVMAIQSPSEGEVLNLTIGESACLVVKVNLLTRLQAWRGIFRGILYRRPKDGWVGFGLDFR
jgi:hypothetical protein